MGVFWSWGKNQCVKNLGQEKELVPLRDKSVNIGDIELKEAGCLVPSRPFQNVSLSLNELKPLEKNLREF
jgi:hypothetical protein